ncbi:micronuclear linker histone polyprotein-like [Polyergus mexicanus]|uniref:micronuclear linker histone polyprotein-like n=1 Tax=Polyergus mexicanus TaxID=615972 RepID=UPI0038B5153D
MSSGNNSGAQPNYRDWSKSSKKPVSSELSSSESIISSSELSSFASLTTCSCEYEGCTNCDSLFRNKKERKRNEIRFMKRRKKLSKRKNPLEMSSKTLKKLESKRKKETLKVLERNKELLKDMYLSDSSDDSDCNCYHTRCNCKRYSSTNKQKFSKNKRDKRTSSKCLEKFTKTATTCESLKCAKKKKSATKSSGKDKTSLFNPYSCICKSRDRNRVTKCAGCSRITKVSKKFTRNGKSNKKVSRKRTTGSSERYSSFSSEDFEDESSSLTSDDTEYESFSNDTDSRDHYRGYKRQSHRKMKR